MRNLDLLIPKSAPRGGSWAWAQVDVGRDSEDDWFAKVQLDGEDAPLEAAPVFLCDPQEFVNGGPRTGRTLVHLLDGQVIVYGQSGGLPRAEAADVAAGKYEARSGRILWTADDPMISIGDGGTGWWRFAPTSGGATAWRTTLTDAYTGGPPEGMTFYDTDLDQLMAWDGTAWIAVGPYTPPTDSGWIDISLASGYEAAETGTPQYRIKDGVVYIRGSIQESASGTLTLNNSPGHTIGTLPTEARPSGGDIVALGIPQNPAANQARLFVWTNGTLKVYLTGSGSASYVSLNATYPVG